MPDARAAEPSARAGHARLVTGDAASMAGACDVRLLRAHERYAATAAPFTARRGAAVAIVAVMVRVLIRIVILLGSVALGLAVASWIVDDVHLSASGFLVTVVVFTVVQAILAPFIAKTTARYAPAFLGGIGLLSTFVALAVASLVGDGLSITGGAGPWILATLIVWLVTALATFLLPFFFLKERKEGGGGTGARQGVTGPTAG